MMQLDDTDQVLTELQSSNIKTVSLALYGLVGDPTGQVSVRNQLETMLSKRDIFITSIKPARYGEVCWLAGHALSFEYAIAGIDKNVVVRDSFEPLRGEEIVKPALEQGISEQLSMDKLIIELIRGGVVQRKKTIVFWTHSARRYLQRIGRL